MSVRRGALLSVAGVLIVAGCSAHHPSADHAAPPTSTAPPSSVSVAAAATGYLLMADDGNRHLDHDFDGLEDGDDDRLPAARIDLTDAAATERTFDRRLLALRLPPAAVASARALIAVNETRAELTTRAAAATSVGQVHSFEAQLTAANAPVERYVQALRTQLGLPPADTS